MSIPSVDRNQMVSSVPPPPPPPPPSAEELQAQTNGIIARLNKDPNDADAKNDLAHAERSVGNEFNAEQRKGDGADPKRLEALEKTMEDIHGAMQQFGVSELPRGGGMAGMG